MNELTHIKHFITDALVEALKGEATKYADKKHENHDSHKPLGVIIFNLNTESCLHAQVNIVKAFEYSPQRFSRKHAADVDDD